MNARARGARPARPAPRLVTQVEVRHVPSLAEALPWWPPLNSGRTWVIVPPPTLAAAPRISTMRPADFKHWTPAGLEQLERCLREGIRRAKAGAP